MRQTINSGSGGDGENSVVAVAKESGQQWERSVRISVSDLANWIWCDRFASPFTTYRRNCILINWRLYDPLQTHCQQVFFFHKLFFMLFKKYIDQIILSNQIN